MPNSSEYKKILSNLDQSITDYKSEFITNQCLPNKFKKELALHLTSLYSNDLDELNKKNPTVNAQFWSSPNFDEECLRLYRNLLTAKALNLTYENSSWSKDNAALDRVLTNMITTLSKHITHGDNDLVKLMQDTNTGNCSRIPGGLCSEDELYHPHWYSCVSSIGSKSMKKHFNDSVNSVAQQMQPSIQPQLAHGK